MKKRILAIFIAITLILSTLIGCDKISDFSANKADTTESVAITAESPYYSVTNGSIIKDKNYYMELEVKIPKITYSNEGNDPVFDPINNEIESTILKHIEESKKTAYDTYKMYLKTAKENIENEKAKKLAELKTKYKSIIGNDEVKAISMVTNEEIYNIASNSIIVDGFTSTADIINAGPHNKRIIIVEKDNKDSSTENTVESTTIETRANTNITNTTNIAPPAIENQIAENNNTVPNAKFNIKGRPGKRQDNNLKETVVVETIMSEKETLETETTKIENEDNKSNVFKKHIASESEFNIQKKKRSFNFGDKYNDKIASKSEIWKKDFFNITDEISLDNFYKELAKIELMRTPSDMILTREYTPMYIYCDFDVKCLDEDYISLYINIYEARTNIVSKVLFYNIDLKNKKTVNIKDILGENYKEICINSINKSIENWPEEKKVLLTASYKVDDFISDNTTFFINNNHKPVVVFDKYAITAGAAGYPEFQIIE